MDIFQFAMEKEKLSENFYHQIAEKSSHSGIRNICSMLAAEESKHFKIIQQMKEWTPETVTDTDVISDGIKMFEQIRKSAENLVFGDDELELYEKARQIERESIDFYKSKAEQSENQPQKILFLKLAAEERKHYILVDNLCELVQKPKIYLENAEFTHIQDYADGVF